MSPSSHQRGSFVCMKNAAIVESTFNVITSQTWFFWELWGKANRDYWKKRTHGPANHTHLPPCPCASHHSTSRPAPATSLSGLGSCHGPLCGFLHALAGPVSPQQPEGLQWNVNQNDSFPHSQASGHSIFPSKTLNSLYLGISRNAQYLPLPRPQPRSPFTACTTSCSRQPSLPRYSVSLILGHCSYPSCNLTHLPPRRGKALSPSWLCWSVQAP